jgi:hypothetical protein
MNYNIIIKIDDGSQIVLPVEYEKEYELQSHVINIGKNGILDKTKLEYFPTHRIDKIEIETKP